MDKLLDPKKTQAIQEEIRKRVLERYAEMQGIQTQESELKATLEALHEVTHIPLQEIEQIASDVMQTYQAPGISTDIVQKSFRKLAPAKDFTFGPLQERVKRKRREFIPHLIAYTCVNGALIMLNLLTTSFPWAMFPLLGWGIGLGSHYFVAVYWPKSDLRQKIQFIESQIHQILQENFPAYQTNAQTKIFHGVHRLLVSGSSQEMLNDYLQNVDPNMPDNKVRQVTIQLYSIREQYVKQ